ncbi:WW domain-binding protein 1-like [Scomber japonicus]|uniref:WW domain-binding protein 1-like n=1 Tax=Scomber japonicus TaxID=13676 RepID=UPI002305D299|nr:WW domain-binding protein 1-like [Scomber japonicus]
MTMSLKGQDRTEATTVANHHGGAGSQPVVSPKYCPGVNNNPGYLCETGHCCGETGCCTYYYELWWFWLLWTVLTLFSCFCAYRHRRSKLRIQQQQRQREINLIAYNGACNYPSSMLDLSFLASFKLPSYEEVAAQPSTPPPSYSSLFLSPSSPPPPPLPSLFGPCCSCESCSLTSPSSTSFSVQVTDETYDSSHMSTPSEAGDVIPIQRQSPNGNPLEAVPIQREKHEAASPHGLTPQPTPSQSNMAVFMHCYNKEEQKREKEEEEEEEEDDEEDHFRHRRLTGDSGIEVCRCRVKREEQEEEELQKGHFGNGRKEAVKDGGRPDMLHDSMDCSLRAKATVLSPLLDDCAEQRCHVSSSSSNIISKTGEAFITVESS